MCGSLDEKRVFKDTRKYTKDEKKVVEDALKDKDEELNKERQEMTLLQRHMQDAIDENMHVVSKKKSKGQKMRK